MNMKITSDKTRKLVKIVTVLNIASVCGSITAAILTAKTLLIFPFIAIALSVIILGIAITVEYKEQKAAARHP